LAFVLYRVVDASALALSSRSVSRARRGFAYAQRKDARVFGALLAGLQRPHAWIGARVDFRRGAVMPMSL
jgi:hypothetical protein